MGFAWCLYDCSMVSCHRMSVARSRDTSAMPAFAEQFGHARTTPLSSAKTRAKFPETCALQWSHLAIVGPTRIVPAIHPLIFKHYISSLFHKFNV